jgi:predicted transcriptional regulator
MSEEVEISEVMTEGVIAVEKDKNLKSASRILQEEGIRGLIVVEDGEAVGVMVCRDIVYQVVRTGGSPEDVTVGQIMSEDLIVAEEDEQLSDVAMEMLRNNVSRIPVVRGDMLVGIVTQSDILRAWPGYAEIIDEREEMDRDATPIPESSEGICESCGNYSESLMNSDGMLMCERCRGSM